MTENEKIIRSMFKSCKGKYPELKVSGLKAEYYGEKVLKIPYGVKVIADRFAYSESELNGEEVDLTVEYAELPDGVEEIERWAFYGLSKIKAFYIPKTVKRVGDVAFHFCHATVYCEDKPQAGWIDKEPEMELHIYQGGTVYEENIRKYNNWNPSHCPVKTGVKREDFIKMILEENG